MIIIRPLFLWFLMVLLVQCKHTKDHSLEPGHPFIIVLGIAQDAGYPQSQCKKQCCSQAWDNPDRHRRATCLALVDPGSNKYWLFEATPDFKSQVREVESQWEVDLAGVFLTHAHVGHYSGLINLGREIAGATEVPVYAMPRMKDFLESNGPWDQLVTLENVNIISLQSDSAINIGYNLSVTPFIVPHRDEYSETVGYQIQGESQSVMFIPDIDKWEKWDRVLSDQIALTDLSFLDGSFFKDGELPNRDMSTIPHPFVIESIELLEGLPAEEKQKVHFIHFNHTNPLLHIKSDAQTEVNAAGFKVAAEGAHFPI